MNKILRSRVCSRLSLVLALLMVLPIISTAAYGDGKTSSSVIISNMPNEYKIGIGKGENIDAGAKGAIVRGGSEIAKFEVTSVEWGYSNVKISDLKPGETLRIGDTARIDSSADNSSGKKIKKKSNGGSQALLAMLLVGAVVALSGHHKGGSSASAMRSIQISPATTSLPADGKSTTQIVATISDGNNAAVPDGTIVQFASNSGSISPAQAATTAGKANAVLTAGTTTGPVTITVTVGGKSSTSTVTFTPSTQSNVGSIELAASPTSIQVTGSGGSVVQSTITATCRDAQGSLATSGTVTFSSPIGSVIGTAPINANGVATSTFSSSATGQAQIKASWSGAEASIPVSITAGPPYTVNVTCAPSAVQCDGHSFATVTATVRDIAGNSVTDGTVVSFSVRPDVTGGGNGTITAESRTTNGVATASLFSRNSSGATSNPGTATVVADVLIARQPASIPAPATDLQNHGTQVQFTSLDVSEIHVGATRTNIRGWDFVNNTTTITAVVYDSHHNPVPDGTAVYFTANHGMIYGNAGTAGNVAVSVTKLGKADATLVTDAAGSPSWHGFVDVTTTSGTVSNFAPGLVIFSGWPSPPHCSFSMVPTTLKPVQDSATITVIALDVNGNPVVDGTTVTVKTTKGRLDTGSPKTVGGMVQVTLSTSEDASSPTALGPGVVTMSIDSGGHNPETGDQPVVSTINFTVE